jgi:hypothetical protein
MGLAGCGMFSSEPAAVADQPIGCPRVVVVPQLADVVQYRPGPGRDPTDIAARGHLDFGGGCEYGDDRVTVALDIRLRAERGPAAVGDSAPFEYFVAVRSPDGVILNKELFPAAVPFGAAATAELPDPLEVIIPLTSLASGARHEVLIGFQLTPEQLQATRAATRLEVQPIP